MQSDVQWLIWNRQKLIFLEIFFLKLNEAASGGLNEHFPLTLLGSKIISDINISFGSFDVSVTIERKQLIRDERKDGEK